MRDALIGSLACIVCGDGLVRVDGSLRCASGHTFDIARAGYVSMLTGTAPGVAADTAAMVAARRRFQDGGDLRPVTDALVAAAGRVAVGSAGVVVDVGGGTGHHLAAALDATPGADGLVVDLSRDAARIAARAHPRMSAVVCDIRRGLPLRDGTVTLLLDVFAPRDGAEMRRVLAPDGALLVVTPAPAHLIELRGIPGMLSVDGHKQARLERSLGSGFRLDARQAVDWQMALGREAVRDVVLMGPSAHHIHLAALDEALRAFPDQLAVTGGVELSTWLPI